MAITVRCASCGKVFQVRAELAGKQARCKCGAALVIPSRAESPSASWGDEVDRAFGPTDKPGPKQGPRKDDPQEPQEEFQEEPVARPAVKSRGAASQPQPAPPATPTTPASGIRRILAAIPPLKKWKPKRSNPWPGRVAIACAAYGGAAFLAIPVCAVIVPPQGLFAVCDVVFRMLMAGAIVAAGVMLARRDPNGPAWAGVSCLLFCASPAWDLFGAFGGLLSGVPLVYFLVILAVYAVLYGIPVAVTVWALKHEAAKRNREEGGGETG